MNASSGYYVWYNISTALEVCNMLWMIPWGAIVNDHDHYYSNLPSILLLKSEVDCMHLP